MSTKPFARIGTIGYGEVGGIFGHDLVQRGVGVATFDILFDEPTSREAMLAKARDCGVRACESADDSLRGCELIISAVTAASAAGVGKDFSWRALAYAISEAAKSGKPG